MTTRQSWRRLHGIEFLVADLFGYRYHALQWAKDVKELYRIWRAEGCKPNVGAFAGLSHDTTMN